MTIKTNKKRQSCEVKARLDEAGTNQDGVRKVRGQVTGAEAAS